MSVVLFPPPFYFVFYISNLLSYIQNNFSYELARPIMGTIFLVDISFTVWTKKSTKKMRKQVRGCLQNLYQPVAILLKYILVVLL